MLGSLVSPRVAQGMPFNSKHLEGLVRESASKEIEEAISCSSYDPKKFPWLEYKGK